MQSMTRRDALAAVSLTVAAVIANACNGGDEKAKPAEKKETKVMRVDPVFDMAVICGQSEPIWFGPEDSSVKLTLASGLTCSASLELVDRRSGEKTPAGLSAPAAKSTTGTVKVPRRKALNLTCSGDANEECTATIIGVEPVLPEGVTNGKPVTVAPGAAVTNPAAPPAVGTPVIIECGKNAVLWKGRPSYVTVRLKGSQKCTAKVETDKGETETTGDRPMCRTFGPVTSLTGSCVGPGTSTCEFQITELIQLP